MESWSPSVGATRFPLLKETLIVGRRESCDIVLRFANVSGQHCQLSLENGYWFVQDLNSQNGVKVNGSRVVRKRLDPGDLLSMARHKYTIKYTPEGPPPSDEEDLEAVLEQVAARPGGPAEAARFRGARALQPDGRQRRPAQKARVRVSVRPKPGSGFSAPVLVLLAGTGQQAVLRVGE